MQVRPLTNRKEVRQRGEQLGIASGRLNRITHGTDMSLITERVSNRVLMYSSPDALHHDRLLRNAALIGVGLTVLSAASFAFPAVSVFMSGFGAIAGLSLTVWGSVQYFRHGVRDLNSLKQLEAELKSLTPLDQSYKTVTF